MYSPELTTVRLLILIAALMLIALSQRYWFVFAWRVTGRVQASRTRRLLRAACLAIFAVLALSIIVNIFFNFRMRNGSFMWRRSALIAWTGLWLSSALFAYLAAVAVGGIAELWWYGSRMLRRARGRGNSESAAHGEVESPSTDLARRHFVHTASAVAGVLPFAAGLYGFLYERWNYQVRHVDLPIAGLPPSLDGLRIAQLSDIHMGGYMPAAEVRRAVVMANALGADLAVVTGDFITRVNDPLEECVAELSRLRAPLGVWGCNGNHEIYAGVEALAADLFQRHGMRLLRQESAELAWRGQPFNLIGVDYQRERAINGEPTVMLAAIKPLVRRDVPNILLSHNPNSFRRAAELGIELMLTGHTHGGQVRVEILDDRFSPARFLTPYVAGIYRRPLAASASLGDRVAWSTVPGPASVLYVNRGLGTIGVPVRLGVPPEINLHTLRRA